MNLHDWKNLIYTQEVLNEIKRRIEFTKEQITDSAGLDPLLDRWRAGAIAAYSDVLNIEIEGEESHGD